MRTITIVVDDTGRTKVEINVDKETQQFFTKREFDQALRAAKLQYRLQKREYRRELILRQSQSMIGETHDQREVKPETEPERGTKASAKRTREAPRGATNSLADALRAKTERNRRAKA